jgi:diaminopimelate decarboxylase
MKKYLPYNQIITPKIHPDVAYFIDHFTSVIIEKTTDSLGVLHVVFPHVVTERIETMQKYFAENNTNVQIYAAHKPTRSTALMRALYKKGVHVDVASLGELEHALSIGWDGKNIECTGSKHPQFIQKAIDVGALISVDSVHELQLVIALSKKKNVRILLRISNPSCSDRNQVLRTSRFGIIKDRIESFVYPLLKDNQHIQLMGFHIHNDERDADVKGEYVFDLLSLIQKAYAQGFLPSIINIGGGWRDTELSYPDQWQSFIESLEHNLVKGKTLKTWRQGSFGLYLNEKGRISGREKIQGKFLEIPMQVSIFKLLNKKNSEGHTVKELINESLLQLMIEPGYTLFTSAGFSAMTVLSVEDNADGTKRVVVDGNMYDLSIQMREQFFDPYLLSKQDKDEETNWEGYIVGNLCREEDMLLKRAVNFSKIPEPGDVIVFLNTSAYSSSFETSHSHMHAPAKELVVYKEKNNKFTYSISL